MEGNYVPAQNLHVTLAFIGEYGDPAAVKEVIGRVPLPEFRLSLSEAGNFGNILWAGIKGNQKLKTYVKELRSALAAAGIPCDKEKFVPHITLIRKVSAKKSVPGFHTESGDDGKKGFADEIRAEEREDGIPGAVAEIKGDIHMCINKKKKNKGSLHAEPVGRDGCME